MSSPLDEKINRAIGARIRELRQRAGLTQAQVGHALGRTKTAVSYMESGRTAVNASQIYRLAQLFGCHPAEVLFLEVEGETHKSAASLLVALGEHLQVSEK